MMKHFTRPLAVLVIASLTACGGGSGPTVQPPTNPSPAPGTLQTTGVPLVGVGDSLTAGYQSSGFLGDTTATSSNSVYPGGAVPPGQENGFWSVMYQEVALGGFSPANSLAMYSPTTSPLPLIKAPGLADQLVLAATIFANSQLPCDTTNQAAFSSSAWALSRMNPSGPVTDLGVPGITMHEALYMSGPLTGPPPGPVTGPSGPMCPGYQSFGSDPTSGGLQSLVSGESEMFYPVLGQFQSTFPSNSLTEVNVAVAMKPKLATVWLGANDILKFVFSNGQSPSSDTPPQLGADLTSIVSKLAATGAKVLVADLPMVLNTPQFFPASNPTTANPNVAANANKLVEDFAAMIVVGSKGAISQPVALQLAGGTGGLVPYLVTTYCGSQCSSSTTDFYLTETGFLNAAAGAGAAIAAAQGGAPQWGPAINAVNGGPLTAGTDFLLPSFAQQVDALNAGYNTAIDTVANGAGSTVALVPVTQLFQVLALGTNLNALPAPFTLGAGTPSATLGFGGGLVSWDGLHPSNLGYGVIAASFVAVANAKLGLSLASIGGAQLAGIEAAPDPYSSAAINALFGGLPVFPLP